MHAGKTSVIENYEPKCRTVTLKEDIAMSVGDKFTVYPSNANWQIHHNTIADCTIPMIVDLESVNGVNLKDNIISPEPKLSNIRITNIDVLEGNDLKSRRNGESAVAKKLPPSQRGYGVTR
jgi:hypothetical protein